jgi:hypothetical protein
MIDIEVVERRSNNYLPLLFLLFGGFLVTLKNILYTLGVMKMKGIFYKDKNDFLVDMDKEKLFGFTIRNNQYYDIWERLYYASSYDKGINNFHPRGVLHRGDSSNGDIDLPVDIFNTDYILKPDSILEA